MQTFAKPTSILHSNKLSNMPTFEPKSCRSPFHMSTLEKLLLALVIMLFVVVGFLLYIYLIEIKKEDGSQESTLKCFSDGSEMCTKQSCVLNAADLMEKMDTSVDPCNDFYGYACGRYDKTTHIPSHLDSIHVLRQLQDNNIEFLKTIIEEPMIRTRYAKNPTVFKLFQAYDMCMEHSKSEENAIPLFKKFIRTLGDSNITSKEWNKRSYNVSAAIVKAMQFKFHPFFVTGVWINPNNSSEHVFFISKPKLGLNSASYLPRKTPNDKKVRQFYRQHMITMLKRVAVSTQDVSMAVDEVLKLEKRIAKILTKFDNGKNSVITIKEFSRYTKFDWLSFFQNLANDVKYLPSNKDFLLVKSKAIFKHMMNIIKNTDKQVFSNFIVWKILQESIPALPSTFGRIQQKFKNTIKSRFVEQPKRWKICIETLSESFQKVFNYLYVEEKFSEGSRKTAFKIFQEIRREFINNLQNKTWMDEKTKTTASEKVGGIDFLVGYSDETKDTGRMDDDYQKLQINGSNFFEAFLKQRSFVLINEMKKLLHPVQKNSFDELTFNANAYYSSQENKITFLAGILQRPIYDRKNSKASNYGSLGMILGHELTHAFDSKGHRYDRNGNLRNWWTSNSLKNFQERTECFTKQYNKFTLLGQRVKGENTLEENIADNGGLKLAYNAFKRSEERDGKNLKLPGLNLTNDQVFFLSFAQVWCSKYTKDALQDIINYRVPMKFSYRCEIMKKLSSTASFVLNFNDSQRTLTGILETLRSTTRPSRRRHINLSFKMNHKILVTVPALVVSPSRTS